MGLRSLGSGLLVFELGARVLDIDVGCGQLGCSQYHLAVAGGCAANHGPQPGFAPTRYREVVLTASKLGPHDS